MDTNITLQTKQMIDNLKAVCTNFGLGNASSEYKIITEIFLYKFLNDKFLYEAKKVDNKLSELSSADVELKLAEMSDDDYELFLFGFAPDTAKLKKTHFVSYLFNHKNEENFHTLFDDTLKDIAAFNIDIFSIRTGGQSKMSLFSGVSQHVIEIEKKDGFCSAIIDKIANCSFESVFEQKYDFFAQIFEYLIKDYNKDFGKYAEYYTPHSIASIIAKILVPDGAQNVTVYDPAAGSGTLVLALAHEIGENNCTIYTQDISQKSNEFLRLNLILNNLVHSLPNIVHDDTLLHPFHKNKKGDDLATFDYIVSNPPFNMDFSDSRDTLAGDNYKKRFWAGVPNIPKKDLDGMAVYLMFVQHIISSLAEKGKAAIVVPSGFLTDTGTIHSNIREYIIKNRYLSAVIQMPTNVFANTNTSVSILILDKSVRNETVVFVDASRMGNTIKINDSARTILEENEQALIVDSILSKKQIPEFSIEVPVTDIEDDNSENMIKPGLYFEMRYELLHKCKPSIIEEEQKIQQRKAGLLRILRSAYMKNLMVDWFVDFNSILFSGKKHITEYGQMPEEIELISLEELIEPTIGGEWGKEAPTGNYQHSIRCIRGTDIPNIAKSYYDDVPTRYVRKNHIIEKSVIANDIIIEISGGSPIQSTGRICFITENIIKDFQSPVLCTNFCRIIRLKDKTFAEYVYNYLQLLYERGYFFNLENNTTGIKNLIFRAFTKNIKVPIPRKEIYDAFIKNVDEYCASINL